MRPDDTLKKFPEIQTPRLLIKALSGNDAAALQKLTNHPEITDSVHFLPTPFTILDAQKLITGEDNGRDQFIGVWMHGHDELAAVIGTHLHNECEIEVGYWVHPARQRQGIARESVATLLAKLADIFPERQIIAECRPENQPSWQLLEKLGFKATRDPGRRPERYRFSWKGKIS